MRTGCPIIGRHEKGRTVTVERWDEYEDEELVVEALLGQTTAFDALVHRYRPAVLAAVLRQAPSRPVAEEICQEAFLRAYRALPHLRDPSRFPAWLHAIARREVIRHGPGETQAASHLPLDEQFPAVVEASEQSVWRTLERREEGEWVRQALGELPEDFQLILTLRYWADMPLEQIARFIDRPLSTVKWRLHRARALMRHRLMMAPSAVCGVDPSVGATVGEAADQKVGPTDQRRHSNDTARERNDSRTAAHRTHAG